MRVIHLIHITTAFAAVAALSSCGQTGGLPGLSCSQGSTWQTVDDFAPSGDTNIEGFGTTADTNDGIYVIGQIVDSGSNTHWVVRVSSDRGATWKTGDDYQLDSSQSTYPGGIAADFSGGVYAVGNPYDGSGASHWTVRKSTDGGTTWTGVDDVLDASANSAIYRPSVGLNVFGELQTGNDPWTSRKSNDSGSTWTNEDSFDLSSNGAQAVSATVDLSGNIYAAGFASDSGDVSHWIVRKSTDGGATWSTVDDFQVSSSQGSSANSIGTDPQGSLFVVGNGSDSGSKQYWIVRKSTDGGSTWSTIRQIQQHGQNAGASGVGFDHLGNIWVSGEAEDSSSNTQWLVETSSDGGTTWTASDSFAYSGSAGTGQSGEAQGFTFTPTGDLYVTGQVTLTDSSTRWVTRKLACL